MFNSFDKSKRALYGLSFGHFFVDLYVAILIPLYPFIAQRLEINLASISLVIAIGHSVSSILQPVFGYISDRLNRRIFMFLGLIFVSIFVPLGYKAPNATILTLCLILGMLGNAFYHPQVTLMIKNFYKENLKLSYAIGLFLGVGTIGYACAPYLSTYFLQKFGDNNYVLIGLVGVLISIFMLFFVPKLPKQEIVASENFMAAIKDILSNKVCIFLIVITVIKAALTMSYGTYIPFVLKKYGFLMTHIGMILTLFYVAGGLSMIFSSKLEKLINLKGVIVASFMPLLPLTFLSLFMLKYNQLWATIFFIVTGFFVLLSAGVVLAHAQRIMTKNVGTISGIIQGFTLSLGALLLIPFGMLGQHFGVECILLLISGIAFIASLYSIKTKLI